MPQSFQEREETRAAPSDKQTRHRPPPSSAGTGHWVRTIGVLVPLVIGEVVKNPEQRWRFIRISSVAMALISEGLYAHKVHQERENWSKQR